MNSYKKMNLKKRFYRNSLISQVSANFKELSYFLI
jgi:hypothetical protein